MPTSTRLRALRYRIKEMPIRDFSGGPDIRDAASELRENEDSDAWNVSFDVRGGVGARLGYIKDNPTPLAGGIVKNIYYWPSGQAKITQIGPSIFKGNSTTAVKTFSTSARVGFADFQGKLCVIHPVDGLFVSTDGLTYTAASVLQTFTVTIATPAVFTTPVAHGLSNGDPVFFTTTGALPTGLLPNTVYYVIAGGLTATSFEVAATSGGAAINTSGAQSGVHTLNRSNTPKGDCLLVWQNKLFSNDRTGANPSRVNASAAGDCQNWPLTGFNDLREKDNEQIVALAGASGVDIQGRPGCLAFKKRSTYRIFDSTTLQYATVDTTVGAASALAVVNIGQLTMTICERGIYYTDGVSAMKDAAAKFMPLWDASQINFAQTDLWCAGRIGNRAEFSLTRVGSGYNDLSIQYIPDIGVVSPGSNAMSCYATYNAQTEYLLGGSPTVPGQVYQLYSGGTDDGAPINSRFQTKWYEPNAGFLAQLWALRLQMNGTFTMAIRKDYKSQDYLQQQVLATGSGPTYDSGATYDSGLYYGETGDQDTVALYGWGVVREFSLRIFATSTTTQTAQQIFSVGPNRVTGAWNLYGFTAVYMPLGWA